MGKRSTFPRFTRDFYRTPHAAVLPLLPHLPRATQFSEPCAGDYDLVGHLQDAGHVCVQSSDIATGTDALTLGCADLNGASMIVTNPPWSRPVLHAMIVHFSALRPTWLLFDADWLHTRQSVPFLPLLRKVVSVGRCRWIPGSRHTGKDNAAWHLLDAKATGPVEFVGRLE